MTQRAYLDERVRKDGNVGYRVRWRLDGAGLWQTETFDVERKALRFRMDVEDAGLRWPQGWIKGIGRVPVVEDHAETHPFEEFALLYLNTRKRTQADTVQRYQRQVHVLAQHFPVVEEVDDQAVANWITAMQAAGSSAKTISNYHGLLFALLAYAVKKGLRPANPCADTQLPDRHREQTDVLTALDETEYATILACLHDDARDLVQTAVGTGLRWGEITALTVGDLALDAAQPALRVTKAWKKNATPSTMRPAGEHRYILGPPKSRRSTRTVTLPPPLVDILVRATAGKKFLHEGRRRRPQRSAIATMLINEILSCPCSTPDT